MRRRQSDTKDQILIRQAIRRMSGLSVLGL